MFSDERMKTIHQNNVLPVGKWMIQFSDQIGV
jgi:hypothetical protein